MEADKTNFFNALYGAGNFHFPIRKGLFINLKFYLFLENTYNIMANVKLIFCGSGQSGTEEHTLAAYCNSNKELFISIDMNFGDDYSNAYLCLDKSTAIKFSKELRKQISYLED